MAIQFRRGAFADFIKSKMVAGEPAVVQSGDTNTQNGKAFYICYTPGSVDRVLTEQDKTALDSQISDIEDDLTAAEQTIENVRQSIPAVDATLTTAGAAADAKKTGDEIADLKSDLSVVEELVKSIEPGLSNNAKSALLACFRHIAFLDEEADYYSVLEDALYASVYPKLIVSFLPEDRIFYTDENVSVLADYLTVRYYQDAEHDAEIIEYGDYSISGSISHSVNTISVSYGGITSTITVNAVVLRYIVLDDIASHVGYNDISVSDGTITASSVETFSVLTYVEDFVRFIPNIAGNRYVYRKEGDNYYVTDTSNFYLFTKDNNKYTATNVTDSESANLEITGSISNASARRTLQLNRTNGTLKMIIDEDNYITFSNANIIGYWGANNPMGINQKFANAAVLLNE